jgi:hypothetical protein
MRDSSDDASALSDATDPHVSVMGCADMAFWAGGGSSGVVSAPTAEEAWRMAMMYPPRPKDAIEHSEKLLWDAFQKLDDRWRVFHSVVWQSPIGRRQGDGEADFVLLHPDHGLILVEVKGGTITVEDGQWFTTNRSGRFPIKNPFDQISRNKYALRNHIQNLDPPIKVPPLFHAVAFPSGSVPGDIGTYGPRDIVIDASDLPAPATALDRIVTHWQAKASLSSSECQSITSLLAPTVTVRSRLKNELASVDAKLIELTQQQVQTLQMLRRVRRAAIVGGPGTGKTVLAQERARRLADDGFSTLLVCYNKPLGDRLASDLEATPGVTGGTFHSLCLRLARSAGISVPDIPTDAWWRSGAPDVLVEAAARSNFAVGAVVVDEGQDFPPDWYHALQMLLDDPDEGPFYVFSDSQQAVYVPGWRLPAAWPEFPLDVNCRNSLQIARKVAAVFGDEPLTLGTEGPAPAFVVADVDEMPDLISDIAARLVEEEQVAPSQIAVLSNDRSLVDRLRKRVVASTSFVELGKRGVVVETIQRFKGLEADVVVLALVAPMPKDEACLLAYVGMSRAKGMLIVIGDSETRAELRWAKG